MLWDGEAPTGAELRVNKDYAHRFEDRKRKQELDRLRQQYGDVALDADGSDDSEAGVEEDDDGALLTRDVDVQIFRTIDAIRARDPAVRDRNKRFFDNMPAVAPPARQQPTAAKPAEAKKLTTRDYMLSGAHSDSDEDGDGSARPTAATSASAAPEDDDQLPYTEQQRRLKKAFLSAFDGDDAADDADALFSAKPKSDADRAAEAEEYATWLKAQLAADTLKPVDERVTLRRYLDEPDANLTPDERFLRDYVTKQLWRTPNEQGAGGREGAAGASDDEGDGAGDGADGVRRLNRPAEPPADDEEDDDFSDREEEFARRMNFRFEEAGAGRVAANPRTVAGSVRRDPKKEARKAADEVRRAAKAAKLEETKRELQRLKALKRDEILNRLEKIKHVSGGARAEKFDVDADFDPATWDAQMDAVFDDEYYAAAEDDPAFASSVRTAARGSGGGDGDGDGGGGGGGDDDDDDDDGDDGDDDDGDDDDDDVDGIARLRASDAGDFDDGLDDAAAEPRAPPAKGSFEAKVKQMADRIEAAGGVRPDVASMLDEYYGLEYEDLLAGEIPTRFRYRSVEPRSFGLKDEELLLCSDRELNKRVPLGWVKRPYVERYATVPAQGERGYRPKPRAASSPGAAASSERERARPSKRAEGASRGDRSEKSARREDGGARKIVDAPTNLQGGAAAPAAPADAAKPPSKKQLRKKLHREKLRAEAGVPQLPAERLAAYGKLKVKKAKRTPTPHA